MLRNFLNKRCSCTSCTCTVLQSFSLDYRLMKCSAVLLDAARFFSSAYQDDFYYFAKTHLCSILRRQISLISDAIPPCPFYIYGFKSRSIVCPTVIYMVMGFFTKVNGPIVVIGAFCFHLCIGFHYASGEFINHYLIIHCNFVHSLGM